MVIKVVRVYPYGFAEIAPGGNLTLHYHSPAEIYVVTNGTGILNKSGDALGRQLKKVM